MAEDAPRITIIAGEASGDLHGASLAARLKQVLPCAVIQGIGGRRMREAGVELLYDSSSWSAIGIAEALKVVPRLLLAFSKLRTHVKACPPDVLVLIDFGVFNVRVARCRPAGVKVLYYFPPSSWCREATYHRLDGITDRVVTPFPWSAEALKERGFRADFFGHPLLDIARPSLGRDEFCARFGFDAEHPIIGLLPGSRAQEVTHNLPTLVIAAARMLESIPGLQFALPLAPSVDAPGIAAELASVPWVDAELLDVATDDSGSGAGRISTPRIAAAIRAAAREDGLRKPSSPVRIKLLPGMAYDVLAHSRAAAVSSGTATVEAAILDCPMVIMYRGSPVTTLEYRLRRRRIKFIGMPNIILNRQAFPELVAGDASPTRVSELMLRLIPDSPERAEMLRDLAEARAILGSQGAVEKTAGAVLELLGEEPAGGTEYRHV